MASWNRRLWRTALRLRTAYSSPVTEKTDFELPEVDWRELGLQLRRLAIAEERGWLRAAAETRASLAFDLERIENRLSGRITSLRTPARRIAPTMRTLYEELLATETEFDGVEVEEGDLSVTTESIVLEGIRLGPFAIRLDLDRLDCEAPYALIALEPNPAASCADTTHPHVHGEKLCAGEGRAALAAALKEGRLFDFFTIVDRILHTYGEGSPYVELSRWYGTPCHDCDSTMNEDDACSCHNCGETLCGDCLVCCHGCSTGFCSGCIDRCSRCDEVCCSGCLSKCDRCRRDVCEACLEESICTDCTEELENQELEDELELRPQEAPAVETPHAPAEPAI